MTTPTRLHVSVSELREMQTCGQRWYFKYELGLKAEPTLPQVRGRVVHEAARINLKRKRSGEVPLSPDEAAALADDRFNLAIQDGLRFTEKEVEEGRAKLEGQERDATVAFSAEHARSVVPWIDPVDIEAEVKSVEPLEALGGKHLLGIIDVVSKIGAADAMGEASVAETTGEVVRDLKTASKRPAEKEVHGDQQLSVYALLYQMAKGKVPTLLAKDVIVRTQKKGNVHTELHTTTRTQQELAAVVESLGRVERIRMAGIVPPPAPPGSWVCSQRWCGFTDRCPFYVKAADASA